MRFPKLFPRLLLIPAIFYLSSSCSGSRSQESLTITGAFALYPLTAQWTDAYQKDHPGVRFDLSAGGAGKGLMDVVAGAADLGMFSRELTDAEREKGIWYVAVAKDAVLPTVSAQNPALPRILQKGLTQQELADIFLSGKPVTWGAVLDTADDRRINVYTRSDAAGAADTWAAYLGGKQEDIRGVGIYGDPGLAAAVGKDPQGIGFNNTAFVYDIKTGRRNPDIAVVPLDLNGNRIKDAGENFYMNAGSVLQAIADGRYPSPPARPLYLIAKGRPSDPALVAFLKWILTKGQAQVKAAGYVPLDGKTIRQQLAKLQ